MEVEKYGVVNDRISLLSNILPPGELKDVENDMNKILFLSNLILRRRNKRLNNFNNRLHERIKNNKNYLITNNKINNEANNGANTLSRNLAQNENEDVLNSQTLEIENKTILKQKDNETDILIQTNWLDK